MNEKQIEKPTQFNKNVEIRNENSPQGNKNKTQNNPVPNPPGGNK